MKRPFLYCLFFLTALILFGGVYSRAEDWGETLFYVEKNDYAGLEGRVNITLTQEKAGQYSGIIFLPGSAELSQLRLRWNASDVKLSLNGKSCKNGDTPLPARDETLVFEVEGGGISGKLSLKTVQGSKGVPALFLNIDESYTDEEGAHTIALMNEGDLHEKCCYGSLTMEGQTFDMKIKGRGNTSWRLFDKKPYNITLYKSEDPAKEIGKYSDKKKASLIDGAEAKQWTILTDEDDPTALRNKIGYDLALAMGIGLPSQNIDVWMNGNFRGNYLLTPKNDYQVAKDGFMVEIDTHEDSPQFTFTGSQRFTVKAQKGIFKTLELVQSAVQIGWEALLQTNSDKYLKYFDLDSWAKLYLLNELYKDIDVSAGSIFFTKSGMALEDKMTAGPVWDLDGTMGRVSTTYIKMDHSDEQTAQGWYIDSINAKTVPFFQRLGMHESFMKRVYEIYNENRDVLESILTDLDAQSALIADSARMNFARWPADMVDTEHYTVPEGGKTYGSGKYAVNYVATDCWEGFTANLKEYLEKRLLFFEDTLGVEMPSGSISGETSLKENEIFTLKLKGKADSYQWQASSDGKTWTDIPEATGSTYSAPLTASMNGWQLRCILRNEKKKAIITTHVASAKPGAAYITEPVTVQLLSDTASSEEESGASVPASQPGKNKNPFPAGEGKDSVNWPVLAVPAAFLLAGGISFAVIRKKKKKQ